MSEHNTISDKFNVSFTNERSTSFDDELTCNPLDTYHEVLLFEEHLPEWRYLSLELKPHSEYSIRNKDTIKKIDKIELEHPETFCHFDPEKENVKRHKKSQLPKTILCHDMANGYHDDCKVFGTSSYDAYTFYNWAGIDIFCYFSHHLVTIPPLGWINVGHAHGVKVIGTVITEHEGCAFWDNVLQTQETWTKFADALVTIAKTLGFDGWLLNIENKISMPNKLIQFVSYFHETLHAQLRDPQLIWYDSVTIEGHLNWQNALNEKNSIYFEICDGFFTNYSWTEGDIASSVQRAGDRRSDLYIGIDVWGRNFFGGGNLNTQEAVKIAHSYGCSLAIFAPAWTHEAIPEDCTDPNTILSADGHALTRHEQFLVRDRALWGSLWPFLNTRLPSELPFKTSFCRGQGKKRWIYGEIISPGPWYNLRSMQYQPNSSHGPHGYVLVTNTKPSEQQHTLEDSKGILKAQDTTSTPTYPNENKDVGKKEGVTIQDIESESSLNVQNESVADATPQSTSDKRNVIRRLRDTVYNYCFSKKSTDQPKTTNSAQNTESVLNIEASSGRSMVNLSVALDLGKKTANKPRVTLTVLPEELQCLELYSRDGFTGGSCLRINPSDEVSPEHRLIRLFHCDFYCQDSLIACVVTKNVREYNKQYLNMKLFVTQHSGEESTVVLVGRDLPGVHQQSEKTICQFLYPLARKSQQFQAMQKYLLLQNPDFYISTENAFGWTVRYYEVKLPRARVSSINCRTGMDTGAILLGYLGLCHKHAD